MTRFQWSVEMFLSDEEMLGLEEARYVRDKCMSCDQPPTIDVLWAEGMGHAWFCAKCFAVWEKEHSGDVNNTKKIEHGIARMKFSDRSSPKSLKEQCAVKDIPSKGTELSDDEILALNQRLQQLWKLHFEGNDAKVVKGKGDLTRAQVEAGLKTLRVEMKKRDLQEDMRWVTIDGAHVLVGGKLKGDLLKSVLGAKQFANEAEAKRFNEELEPKDLTGAQREAVEYYTSEGYEPVNGSLRGLSVSPEYSRVKIEGTISQLDSIMGEAPESFTTERFFGKDYNLEGRKVGDSFVDKGFSSTSLRVSWDYPPGFIFTRIRVPKGFKVVGIDRYSVEPGEFEVLLGRGSTFTIVDMGKGTREEPMQLVLVDQT